MQAWVIVRHGVNVNLDFLGIISEPVAIPNVFSHHIVNLSAALRFEIFHSNNVK